MPRLTFRKLAVTAAGPLLIFVGIALLVLPGPGLLLIGAGLALLGTEYHWAHRLMEPVRKRLEQLNLDKSKQPPKPPKPGTD